MTLATNYMEMQSAPQWMAVKFRDWESERADRRVERRQDAATRAAVVENKLE